MGEWFVSASVTIAFNAALFCVIQPNSGVQVLPVLWRRGVKFGMGDSDDSNESEQQRDLGVMSLYSDRKPTLDDITIDGISNIRTGLNEILMDSKWKVLAFYASEHALLTFSNSPTLYDATVQANDVRVFDKGNEPDLQSVYQAAPQLCVSGRQGVCAGAFARLCYHARYFIERDLAEM